MTDTETWREFTSKPLVDLAQFYAENPRRKTEGHKSFGFDWKDPSVTGPDTFCEVYWYRGTHEIAAVYSTFDRSRLEQMLGSGSAAMSVIRLGAGAGPVAGPVIGDAVSACALGHWLGDRDLATTSVQVRVLGVLEHALERYWALRDAFFLETQADGLATLQQRIDACAHGDRTAVSDDPWWEELRELLAGRHGRHALEQ